MDQGAGGPTCRRLARELPGAFHGAPVTPGRDGWTTLHEALEADRFARHVAIAEQRWGTDDTVVALSLLVRELTVAATTVAVTTFTRDRRLLDESMSNVACRQDGHVATIGLLSTGIGVLRGDELAGGASEVFDDEDSMASRLQANLLDGVVPAIIDAARTHVHIGERHLWGNVALAIANTLTTLGRDVGARADRDRERLLAARPELAPTIELINLPDVSGGSVTFAVRRTCCLLDRIPGAPRCGTCSLNDRETAIRLVGRYFVAERRAGYGAPR